MTKKRKTKKVIKYSTTVQIIAAVIGIMGGNFLSSLITNLTGTQSLKVLSIIFSVVFGLTIYFKMLPVVNDIKKTNKSVKDLGEERWQ